MTGRYHESIALPALFGASLRDRAGEIGLEWQGRTLTFGEIASHTFRLARALRARGIGSGDRLAVYLPNSPEYIALFLATVHLGAVLVPINVLYREREAGHILRDAEPRAVVADGALPFDPPVSIWQLMPLIEDAVAESDAPLATDALEPDTPAAIIYTSGTTGPAKGAVLTHANFAANARTLVDAWRFTAQDRLLLALPLFHVHGLGNGVHCWLASGARMRLLPRFEHERAATELLDFRPTVFFGVPTMYVRLLEIDPAMAATIGRAARLFVSGSAPLPVSVCEQFERRFGHRILERYGMSETLMTLSQPYEGTRRPGTVGRPLPGVSIRIVSGDGIDVVRGETGELWVQSPTVFAGYWRRPDATAAAFRDGWFRTGDLASQSGDGCVTLKGRAHELIISGGFNIYPREIEEVLLDHPAVAEAAVVGVPDAVRGEVPCAFVVAAPGASIDAADLEGFCRRELASFKVPRRFVVAASLPRTALGKVQKQLLVQQLARDDSP